VEYKVIKLGYKFLTLFFLGSFLFQNSDAIAAKEPLIRVLIARGQKLRVRSDGKIPMSITSRFFSNKKIKGFTINRKNNRTNFVFDINRDKLYEIKKNKKFTIRTSDKRGLWLGGKRYSGTINILLINDEIFAVNILGIEQYLSSVVGSEMPPKWHLEALKAQAIASRTYALKKKGNGIYDIDSTQNDQVYNGLESRTYKTRRAVRSTRSLVIIHNDKLINALFHSSSGGITENSQDVWSNNYPYLSSVKDFDHNNPKLTWSKNFTRTQFQKEFPDIGLIKDIKITGLSDTGRIKTLKIYGVNGSKDLSGKDFRRKMKLNSTLFRFKIYKKEIDLDDKLVKSSGDLSTSFLKISGMGSGHGVGMSQWGAKFLAQKGYNSKEILKHYYKGVNIKPFKNIYR
tara:strand:+ start:1053 stop:2252 length:1200 start_codon:yes stop_codon:yes gene_type:complete